MTSTPTVTTVTVTPELALEWLTRNNNNRTLSKKHVALLSAQMIANEFAFVGDPVRFDTDGRLLDGQHRLNAIIESEKAQQMVVITNLPPESQVYMDAGRKRSPGDQMTVALGIRNGNQAAAIVRTYIQWRDGVFLSEARKISIPEIVTWATDHEDLLVEATTRARRVSSAHVPTSVAVSGAVYLAAHKVNAEDAATFWDRLADGAELDADNPILTLRNGIMRRAKRERWTRVEEWAYYTRCWNTWRKNGRLEKLQGWRHEITLANLRLR
jgi:hypothetical protein